jgi:N-ethylmaleimide reductase
MTRCRADPTNGIPNELHVKYYSERAEDAGLVLTECCAVSQHGEGFPGACQVFNKEQMEGWKKVADAVHKNNGVIFVQIYHAGRATNSTKTGGKQPVSASDLLNKHSSEYNKFEEPRELTKDEIKEIVQQFAASAKLLKDAGVDGVELHGANGYLVDQFLRDGSNKRTDNYGGSVENRSRFALEVIDELVKVFGKGRVGIKLSPVGRYNDMYDSDPVLYLTIYYQS